MTSLPSSGWTLHVLLETKQPSVVKKLQDGKLLIHGFMNGHGGGNKLLGNGGGMHPDEGHHTQLAK